MIVFFYLLIVCSYILTCVSGVIDPPAPDRIHELINNPFLEPEIFEQYTKYDFSDLLSEDLSSKNGKTRKPRKRRKYANEQEAREARLARTRECSRSWRAKMRALPEGSELKIARNKKRREYQRKKSEMLKNLPDGTEKKEAKRRKIVEYNRKRIKMMKNLPDEDPKKQRFYESRLKAQLKRQAESLKNRSKKQQKHKQTNTALQKS